MAFMQPQIVKQRWLMIDGPNGTEHIPDEFIREPHLGGFSEDKRKAFTECDEYTQFLFAQAEDYRRNEKAYSVEFIEGYGARFSAPGYLDATDWTIFDTEAEAVKHLLDQHFDDDPDAKTTFSAKLGEHDIEGDVINPGDWFGKAWLIEIGCGYSSLFFIVEADCESDALDELSGDDKHKHHLLIAPEDFGDWGHTVHAGDIICGKDYDSDCFINLRGEIVADELPEPYFNDGGEPCDLENVRMYSAPKDITYHVEDFGDVSPKHFA